MKTSRQWWIASLILSALWPAGLWAQDPVLIREVVSREVSIHVGGVETTPQKEIVSREVSIHVENGVPDREVVSREYDILVDAPGTPPAVTAVTVTLSPTGDSMTLDWAASNPWAVRDIQWFDIYLSDSGPITDITGLTAYRRVGGSVTQATLDGLTAFTDHYFAIVAVDGQGNRLTTVPGKAAYVLMPEVVSREVSLFVGQEPEPPYKQVVSREYDICVDVPGAPPAIGDVVVSLNAAGDVATLDWSSYNQWAVGDVQRFDIYLSDSGAFSDVTGMTPYASIGGGATGITLSGLTPQTDHYFAVVPVDALGNRIPQVNYAAGYVLMPELVSREVSLFVGQEPVPPYREVVSREVSLVVSDGTTPAPVTGIDSGFTAVTSVSSFGAIDVDWTSYNELSQKDVSRYRVYLSDSYFESVTGMEPHSYVQTGRQTATIDGFPSAVIRYVAVVAEDSSGNFNSAVRAHSVQASYLPYFRFFDDTVEVYEGEVAEIAVALDGLIRTGQYLLSSNTAIPFNGVTGDYVDAPTTLEFKYNPSINTSEANIKVPIIRDSMAEPQEDFTVLIINPNGGSSSVVEAIRVLVREGGAESKTGVWHPEKQVVPNDEPVATHRVSVNLDPAVPGAQWRLVGEPFWRDPGTLNQAGPLAYGRHRVEYKPVAGRDQPVYFDPEPLDPLVNGPDPRSHFFSGVDTNQSHVFETTYPVASSPQTGGLMVSLILPHVASASTVADRGQWRLIGEGLWRNAGSSVSLPVGKHLIEFKNGISGHHAPVPRSVRIVPGVQTLVSGVYEVSEMSGEVDALSYSGGPAGTNVSDTPQSFIGQIETAQGYGTGVAATMHTVLTAARVVFDPDRLAGATDIAWFHQRHADYGEDLQDHFIPEVRYPRGYKLLTGYASARSTESAAGAAAPPGGASSDQKDVAVLYFKPDSRNDYLTARSGYSGFLADFATYSRPNPWLTGDREKKICGYPLSGVDPADRGLMHASPPLVDSCESFGGLLYRSNLIPGLPGMEGAPLLVKHPNGSFYPAAVYLGQNGGAIFRSIDRFLAAAIYLAEWEVIGRLALQTGGGGQYVPLWSDDDSISGFLYVDFSPSRARWRVLDPVSSSVLTDWLQAGSRIAVESGQYVIEYESLAGFTEPSMRLVSAQDGLTSAIAGVSYRQTYEDWAATQFTQTELGQLSISGPDARLNDLPNIIAFGFGLEPGAKYRPVANPEASMPGLPRVTIDSSTQPPTIAVDFLRRNSTITPELDYIIEFADSPSGPWGEAVTTPETRVIDDEWEHVHLTSAPVAEAGRKFVRIRVERTSQ